MLIKVPSLWFLMVSALISLYYGIVTHASLESKLILPSSVERVGKRKDIVREPFSYPVLLLRNILSTIPKLTHTSGPVMRFRENVSGFRMEMVRIGITIS